jgi:hypothetical protein
MAGAHSHAGGGYRSGRLISPELNQKGRASRPALFVYVARGPSLLARMRAPGAVIDLGG